MTSKTANPIKLNDRPEQSPNDIYQNGVDEERCISGRIKMVWPLRERKKIEILAVVQSSPSGNNPYLFKIFFELGENYNEILHFSPSDDFRLSLKGAKVDKLAHPPKLSSLPMQLVFSEGVHIQWNHRGEWKNLNTWPLKNSENNPQTDNWFLSQDEIEANSQTRGLKRNQDDKEETENDIKQGESHASSRSLRKRLRLEAKRQKQEASSRNAESSRSSSNTSHMSGEHPLTSNVPRAASSGKPDEQSIYSMNPQLDSQVLPIRTERNMEVPLSKDTPEFKAGLHSGSIISTAIKDIRPRQVVSLIGVVVTLSTPKTTRTGEWMRFVHIVDPSNYTVQSSGIKINCFAKRYKEWLPHPEVGDVLILKNVKIEEYMGTLTGVCHNNRLSWAAFSATKGEFHHGPPNTAPREEGLAEGGFGVLYSPFFQPGSAETIYCIKLSDWWRNTTAQDPLKRLSTRVREGSIGFTGSLAKLAHQFLQMVILIAQLKY
ncbi:hypothetical protein BJ912DRAFT_506644 [Pholiota molesta]|nr:hypothetical protein BJ912DRAFT_506644 [Pholiota molesta]